MVDNPWIVESIQAFSFLKCPECSFDTKEEVNFQEHAIGNHPLSNVLFNSKIEDDQNEYCESKEDVDTTLISPNIGFGQTGIFGLEDIIQLAKDDTKPNG